MQTLETLEYCTVTARQFSTVVKYGSTPEIDTDMILGTRRLSFFVVQRQLGHVVDVTADENHMLFLC